MLTNKKHSFKKEVASTATKGYKIALLAGVIILFSLIITKAQLTATGQIRKSKEIRAGFVTLHKKAQNTALYNSQRARLNLGYSGYRFKVFKALLNVRAWG